MLRAIKNMRCSDKFRERNFAFTLENKQIGSVKRNSGFYQMTERGFMFLVMGFTGVKADAIKESFIDAFEWMAGQLERILKSDIVRYNQVSLKHEQRKQHVSCSARDMRAWQDEKPVLDAELFRLEAKLQPSLEFDKANDVS